MRKRIDRKLSVQPLEVLLLSAIPFVLAACSGASSDPTKGGLAGGINGIVTGAYEKRIQVREGYLRDLDDSSQHLERRLASARAVETSLALERNTLKRRLAKAKRSAAQFDAQIAELRQTLGAKSEELGELELLRDKLRKRLFTLLEREERHARMMEAVDRGRGRASQRTSDARTIDTEPQHTAPASASSEQDLVEIESDQRDLEKLIAAARLRAAANQ
ncbi:MAG: hypothetical protein KJ622_12865 [Alphaproteobacteria bacterium]|nr:hypothetical protein [Alphaproteobacteria bacterium]